MTDGDPHARRAWLATLCALLVVAGFLVAKAGRDAILLTHYSVESLPLFIGISAALALPVIVIAGKLMAKHGPHRLVPMMNAASAVIAVAEWLVLPHAPRATAVVVFVHLNTSSAVLVSGFWSIINERFDITTAKRHIGRIGMGATLGGIVGGLIAERTAAYFTPETILLVLAALQGIAAALLSVLGSGSHAKEVVTTDTTWQAFGSVVRSSLLRNAGLIVVLTSVGAGALDYVFKADIVHGGSRADLLRALAVFYTVTNVLTAIVQVVLSGPALTWLGVPRTVGTLPATLSTFSLLSLIVPLPGVAMAARGAELVARNSIYRAGYELLYAPLPAEQKRPTKVVLDVGADKLGDMLSAQLVAGVLWLAHDPRTGLLLAAAVIGVLSLAVALALPRSYRTSLEEGLLEKMSKGDEDAEAPRAKEPWVSLAAMPAFGHPGEAIPLQLRRRRRTPPAPTLSTDKVVDQIRGLRSGKEQRIKAALAGPLPAEALPAVIELLGHAEDGVARAAMMALRQVAPRCTGALVDALLDPARPERLRRRIPPIVVAGQPDHAAWGLWRATSDKSFDVRFRSSVALSGLVGNGPFALGTQDEVFARVREELAIAPEEWRARKLESDAVIDEGELDPDVGLAHVFRILGLVLPAEPLRVALRAAKTDDPELRGIALEYLESILPPDVRAQVWPLLDASTEPRPEPQALTTERSQHLLSRLRLSTTAEHAVPQS